MAQWQAIPRGRDLRKANNFADGLVSVSSPFFISENAIVDGYGWDFEEYPALQVRVGRTNFGASGGAITNLLTNAGNRTLFRVVGNQAQVASMTTSTWVNVATVLAGEFDATNFDIDGQALIIVSRSNPAKYFNLLVLTDIPEMPRGLYVASDNRRVYTAGVADMEDVVYYSAFQDALDWTSPENSGAVQFYTANGGPITGIRAFQGQIWAFKRDAYCLIFHTGDARVTHRLVEGSNDIGCVSFKTIAEVGELLIWLGDTDVYAGAGGSATAIGRQIKRYIDSINPNAIQNSCAWTDNERYYLCIPTGSNTQPNMCLVYDTRFQKWLPYSADIGGQRFGAQLNNVAYCSDATGQTYRMNDGTTDAGAAIPWQVISRPMDDGMKEAEKELHAMHLQGTFPSGSTMSVAVSPDDIGANWFSIDYDPIATNAAIQNKNLIVPLDTIPLCNFYSYRLSGTGPATIQEVQRYSRIQPVQY